MCCCSHRPVDVHNIYNQVQVKLLMRPDELHDVPQFDEVFSDDEVCQSPYANFFYFIIYIFKL